MENTFLNETRELFLKIPTKIPTKIFTLVKV